jgi:hypothetical protein
LAWVDQVSPRESELIWRQQHGTLIISAWPSSSHLNSSVLFSPFGGRAQIAQLAPLTVAIDDRQTMLAHSRPSLGLEKFLINCLSLTPWSCIFFQTARMFQQRFSESANRHADGLYDNPISLDYISVCTNFIGDLK